MARANRKFGGHNNDHVVLVKNPAIVQTGISKRKVAKEPVNTEVV